MGNSISVFRITISKYTAIGKHIIIVRPSNAIKALLKQVTRIIIITSRRFISKNIGKLVPNSRN